MGKNRSNSRRSFLVGGVLSIPALAISQKLWILGPTKSSFISEYTINVSRIEKISQLPANYVFAEVMNYLVAAQVLSQQWVNNYSEVKNQFIKKGLLVDYKRIISEDGKYFTCVDSWISKEALFDFIEKSDLKVLNNAYIISGFKPKLDNIASPILQKLIRLS